jgi:hypothetical protein
MVRSGRASAPSLRSVSDQQHFEVSELNKYLEKTRINVIISIQRNALFSSSEKSDLGVTRHFIPSKWPSKWPSKYASMLNVPNAIQIFLQMT